MAAHISELIIRIFRGQIARQLGVAIAVLLALLLRVALAEQSITLPTYVTFYPVVFLAAVLGGIWEGILATTFSALLADYFLLEPVGQFGIHSTSDIVGLLIFSVSGVSVSIVTELYRRNRTKLAASSIRAAILDERRKAEETGDLEEAVLAERQRFLEVLESLRTDDISAISSTADLIGQKLSAAGHESTYPALYQRKFRAFLRRTVTIPFIGALVLAGAALWAAYNLNASMQLVDHTDQVIAQSRRLLKLTVDMETGERGYLVTGNDTFLQPYEEASKVIDSEYQKLHLLVADTPPQQTRLEALHTGIHHWQGYAELMIALRRTGGDYADLATNLAGKAEVDQIRDQIAEFQGIEEHLSEERNRTAHRDWRLVETICIFFGLVIGSGLMVFTYRRMRIIAASFEKSGRALAESERRWATTLSSIGDAVLATDNQGRITYLNPVAAALTGWQLEEAMGQPIQRVFRTINEDTREPADDIVSRVFREQRVVELANHTSLLTKDGREIPIADSAAPIFDSEGKITGVVLVFHDVTEKRRVENELRATLQRFYAILSNLNAAVLLVTDKGQTEYANQALCDVFGFGGSPADQIGVDSATMIERIKSSYRDPEQQAFHIREIVDRGERVVNEEISMKNGRVFLRDYAPLTVDGKLYGRLWVHTDITERQWAEQALNESRAKMAAAMASMTDSVLITDADGRFVEVNEAFATFYRFKSKAECADNFDRFRNIFELFMPNGEPVPTEMFASQRALRGETGVNAEYKYRRKDTGESWIGSISFSPIRDENGTIIGSVVTSRDITESKRLEMRLRRFYESDLYAILYWTIDGGVVDANDKFLQMTGYTREDLDAGRLNWAEMTPPEYQALDEDARRQVRETGIHLPMEKEFICKDGSRTWVLISAVAYEDNRNEGVSFILDINRRKQAEEERHIAIDFLAMMNQSQGTRDLLQRAANFIQERTGCEAVGIRLREGEDYPYVETRGFSNEFVQLESKLCARTITGHVLHDKAGIAILECLCGSVIREHAEPLNSFYTARGSFWTNSITDLVAGAKASDLPFNARLTCKRSGYESVALLPMYVGEERIGLVQLNDSRKERFSSQSIVLWERMAGHLSTALAKFQIEEALREERATLQGILDATDESVWLIGADSTILSANTTALKRVGRPAGEIIGKTIHEISEPKLAENRSARVRQVVETAQPLEVEDERAGISFRHHYYPVEDSNGRIDRVVVYSRDITQSKKAEEALQRYRLLAAHTRDIVLFIRFDDGLILEANAAAAKAYGYTIEQLKCKTIHDLRETSTRPLAPIEMAQAEMQGMLFESIHQRADGSVFPVEVSSQGMNIGGTRTLISIIRDITERKRAEEDSKNSFAALSNFVPQFVWMCTPDGLNTYFNQRWVDYTGLTLEESYGRGWNTPFHPEDKQPAFDAWNKAVESGGGYSIESRLRAADGSYRRFLMRGEPMFDASGSILRWFGTCTDIEDMKQESEGRFQAIIDGAPDTVVFLKDIEGRFITVNSRFEEMLGITRDDVRGKTDYDIMTRDRADYYRAHDQQVLSTGQPMLIEEMALLADGKEHTLLASKFPLFDADGKPNAVCAISSDITERKRMEEVLQESEKRYRNLFTTMTEGFCIVEVLFDANEKPVDYRFLQVNDAFEKQTGLHDAAGKRMRELAPDHEEHWFEIYGRIALTGEPQHFMNEAKALDRWYDVHAYRVGEPEQRRVAIVFNDFSDYKRAEVALRRSEEQFRNLANAIPQLSWMANADGGIFWYNDRWYEYTGTTPEQMEGWGWQSVHDPDVLPQVLERWKLSIATETPFDMVFPIRGADGVFRPFLTRVMPIRDEEGRVVRWFGTNTDISEQKKIEADLRSNEERLSLALDVAEMGEWERDLKTGVGTRSLRHAKIFGYSEVESEWNFDKFLTHILPENHDAVTEWYKSSLTGGSWGFETPIRRLDGEMRWAWFRSHTRLDEKGKPTHAYGIVMDTTERKRVEEELRKLNRTLTALSNSNQAILQVADEKTFLDEVCRIVIRDCGYAMVWIGVAEHDKAKTVRPVAYSGFDDGYLETLRIRWDESKHSRGPTGTATRTGEPAMCQNMHTDPVFAPWRANATKRGYASSLAIPLKNQDEVWGVITIYSRETDSFSDAELDLLKELARDIESGVQVLRLRAAQARAEEALKESREQLGLFIEHAPAALAMFDSKMGYLHASRRWKEDYGLGDRELAGLSHYEVFPAISEQWKEAHRRGLAGEVLSGDADRFERADGTVQLIRWEVRPWHESEGKVGGIVIFSEDISERKKTEEALLRSEKEAFQRQQLQALAKRLQQVREEERKMVARDLHDQIGQILTAIKLDVSWVIRRLPKSNDEIHNRLSKSVEYVNDGVRSVRRICTGLRPGILDDLGLAPAIEWQAHEFSTRTGIACEVSVPSVDLNLDGDRATALFRIFQECLTNVSRHSKAQSVRASLSVQDKNLILAVEDDGKGFLESEVTGSLGVLGMKERAQVCGGSVKVSSSPGKGTTVTVIVPAKAANTERDDDTYSDSR